MRALWLSDPAEGESITGFAKRSAVETIARIEEIAGKLSGFGCPVIINTVYDPSDGDDSLADSVGLHPHVRGGFEQLNEGIRQTAERPGFLLADLTKLFSGHGILSSDPWFVKQIEPNYAGATAIAKEWRRLYEATLT